jgi:hypothetical protein
VGICNFKIFLESYPRPSVKKKGREGDKEGRGGGKWMGREENEKREGSGDLPRFLKGHSRSLLQQQNFER